MQLLEYTKKNLSEILQKLKQDRRFIASVTDWRVLPPAPAVAVEYPDDIAPALKSVLHQMGISKLYSHQEEAYRRVRSGENVVIVTPTASGKTLCYNLPVIQTILENPEARALYFFPTKALSQDQVAELHEIITLQVGDGCVTCFIEEYGSPREKIPVRAILHLSLNTLTLLCICHGCNTK